MTNSSVRASILVSGLLLLGACSSTGTNPAARTSESSRDKITSMEIAATPAATAYDLVNRLRPAWLRTGGAGSIGGGRVTGMATLVYLDGTRMGGLDALRTMNATGIRSMEWIAATRAAAILRDIGSDSINGVISISTEK